MAKFATALCILFVAVGAQGLNLFGGLSSIASDVASKVEAGLQKVDTASQTVESDVQSAIATAENKITSVNTTVQALITALENKYDQLAENYKTFAAKAQAISTCITSNVNITEITEEIAANASSCTTEALTKLETQYETTLTAIETFTTAAATFEVEYEACAANLTTVLSCRTKLYASVTSNDTSVFTTLASDLIKFYVEYFSFGTTATACGSSAAIGVIKSEWQTAATSLKTCINDATSTSS